MPCHFTDAATFRAPEARQHLARGLLRALGPAELLGLEAVHVGGDLRRAHDIGQVFRAPTDELCTVAEIQIFGDRIVLPAARVGDRLAPQNARGAVEVQKPPGPTARGLLDDEVSVEGECGCTRQLRVTVVEIRPPGLNDPDLWVREVRDCAPKKVARNHEIRIEHSDEFATRMFEPIRQRAALESLPIIAV